MTSPHHADDFLHDLRCRSAATDGVFRVDDDLLAVFDPVAAREVNAANWRDLVLPDRLVDLLRRRPSPVVPWRDVRAGWLRQSAAVTTAEANARLAGRMATVLDRAAEHPTDLVTLTQEAALRSMLPVILSGLTGRDEEIVQHDLRQKTLRLLGRPVGGRQRISFTAGQVRAGLVVRRAIRRRARGARPPYPDLTDPVVARLPALGMDRAVDAVVTLLTAIAGPPGAAATCLLHAVARHGDWAGRLVDELAPLDVAAFHADPVRTAPVAHRFVKEVLRMWTPPLVLTRFARTTIRVRDETLEPGQGFLLSPHLIHRDPRYWRDPDSFDPDRWLPGAANGPAGRGHYVPFGWAPKTCVGADLGTIALLLLCHLVCTRYRLEVAAAPQVPLRYAFVAVPQGFVGRLVPR